ncbi:transposase [Streptomyces luteogriseus]|uniref:transposase n=1 Tax=Streptomyces luteogriseus TaxID=68233 RepID=UPI0038109C94
MDTCSRRYSEEFKRDAVALVCSCGRTVTEVAREIGVSAETIEVLRKAAVFFDAGRRVAVIRRDGCGPVPADPVARRRAKRLGALDEGACARASPRTEHVWGLGG